MRDLTVSEAGLAEYILDKKIEKKPNTDNRYVKLVWYGDEIGGKVIVFNKGLHDRELQDKLVSVEFVLKRDKADTEKNVHTIGAEQEGRLLNNISRAKSKIYEICACNPWTWFFTGTIDGKKLDRNDLSEFIKKLSQAIRDYRRKTGKSIKYILIPEKHKNGGWHVHGLFEGLDETDLHKFTLSEKLPKKIRDDIKNGYDVYNWEWYSDRFGFTTLTKIRDRKACCAYVTKYVTKSMASNNLKSGAHMYYASKGLEKAQVICEGYTQGEIGDFVFAPDYFNEYVAVANITSMEEMCDIWLEVRNFWHSKEKEQYEIGGEFLDGYHALKR